MKATLFHGTSADNLPDILRNGLRINPHTRLWNCSENAVYFWSPYDLVKAKECEDDYSHQTAKQRAIESAQFALSIAKDCRIVVIQVEIDESEIEPDESCPNMSGAVCVRRDIKPREIKTIEVSNDLSLLRGYFLSMTLDREYSAVETSPLEEKIARTFLKSDIYMEEVDEMIVMSEIEITTRKRKIA